MTAHFTLFSGAATDDDFESSWEWATDEDGNTRRYYSDRVPPEKVTKVSTTRRPCADYVEALHAALGRVSLLDSTTQVAMVTVSDGTGQNFICLSYDRPPAIEAALLETLTRHIELVTS